ncbi:MAG: hypothetical protein QM731_12370 [Chitinophagaceae bacterium]
MKKTMLKGLGVVNSRTLSRQELRHLVGGDDPQQPLCQGPCYGPSEPELPDSPPSPPPLYICPDACVCLEYRCEVRVNY